MRWLLLVIGSGLAGLVIFELSANPIFIDGGSRLVTHFRVPPWSAGLALGFYILAAIWTVFRWKKARVLSVVAILMLLMTTHGLSEDATKGQVVERMGLIAVRRLDFPLADGPDPIYRPGVLWMEVETPSGSMLVFRGLPPFRIAVPES